MDIILLILSFICVITGIFGSFMPVLPGPTISWVGVLLLYLLLFFRFIIAAHKANSPFGRLLVAGLGFPIIFQALINMGVAVGVGPITGQPLPLLSMGGTSLLFTGLSLGIILSVSRGDISEEVNG